MKWVLALGFLGIAFATEEICTDTNGNAGDVWGYDCPNYYYMSERCGDFDHDFEPAFDANEMCCACGGGTVTCPPNTVPNAARTACVSPALYAASNCASDQIVNAAKECITCTPPLTVPDSTRTTCMDPDTFAACKDSGGVMGCTTPCADGIFEACLLMCAPANSMSYAHDVLPCMLAHLTPLQERLEQCQSDLDAAADCPEVLNDVSDDELADEIQKSTRAKAYQQAGLCRI